MSLEEGAKRIEPAEYDTRQVEQGSREKLLDRVAWAAYYDDRVYEGCSRSVLQALHRAVFIWEMEGPLKQALPWQAALPEWVRPVALLPVV